MKNIHYIIEVRDCLQQIRQNVRQNERKTLDKIDVLDSVTEIQEVVEEFLDSNGIKYDREHTLIK